MLAGEPEWMISRSVAQIATASIRTSTSARLGTGTGLSRGKSSSGSPSTQAFIWSGTGRLGNVLTPAGWYIGRILIFCGAYRKRAIHAASSSIPKLLRPAQLIGGLFGGIQQLLDLAALGTHDGPRSECNRLHFLLIGVGSDLRGHFLMHGDVVQRTEAVLQAGEGGLVAGELLCGRVAVEQALEEVDAVAQFLHRDAQLVAVTYVQVADIFRALLRLGDAAVEQIGGKCPGAPPVVHRPALQPGAVFDPLQRVEDQQPIARAGYGGLCGLGGDGAPVVQFANEIG